MVFNAKQHSIILKIYNDLHMGKKGHHTWWELNKNAILSTLSRKQSDITGYMKLKSIGK